MNRFLLTVCCALLAMPAFAQFYYQDIYTARRTEQEHAVFQANKVSKLTVKSLDARMENNNDFVCEKTFLHGYRQINALTKSNQTGASLLTTYFSEKGKLTRSVDSSYASVNTSVYIYGDAGRISAIRFSSTSGDKMDLFTYAEAHIYEYDTNGRLQKMIRRKDSLDYSTISFKTDDKGNVTEETEKAKDFTKTVYYKYDDQGQLTDIYRYNPRQKRMVADDLFDYDEQGRLSQMTTVLSNAASYNVWKYFYDDKGLITKEECYDRGKTPLGMVKFSYEFNP